MLARLRHYLLAAALSLGVAAGVGLAQPTFYFDPEERIANTGDRVCIDLSVDDFTDMLTVDFVIEFDSTVMTFDGIAGAMLPGLSAANFTLPAPGAGRVVMRWAAPGAASGVGETFPDFRPIVQLCFRVVGPYGSASPLVISDDPAPFLTRENSGGRNIRLFKRDGIVAVGVLPLRLAVGDARGAAGSTVCLEVTTVAGYDRVTQLTTELLYDPAVLEFVNATNLSVLLPGLGPGAFSTPGPGRLRIDYRDASAGGSTLPDGTRLFELCFRLRGACDQSSSVTGSTVASATTVRTAVNVRPIGLRVRSGQVDVAACVGELRLRGATVTGATGDSRCVGFTVSGFSQLESLILAIDFDPALLRFQTARVMPGAPAGLTAASFDASAAASGRIQLNWTSAAPRSVRNGFQLFELCFEIIGPANTVAEITPQASGAIVEQSGIGLIPLRLERPAQIVTLTSTPVVLDIGSGSGPRLGEVCVDVTVSGFRNVQTFRHSLRWNTSVLEFARTEAVGLPFPTHATFTSSTPGQLGLNWWSASGQDLPDGATVYRACFRVVGPPGACTAVELGSQPNPTFVEYAATQGYNSGLSSVAGEVCVEDDRAFIVDTPDDAPVSTAGTCIDIPVRNYRNVERWSFNLAFDPSAFTYDRIESRAVPGVVVDASQAAAGRLGFSVVHASPTTLADGAALFALCLSAKPGPPGCGFPFAEESSPVVTSARVNGQPRRIDVMEGSLCRAAAATRLSVTGVVTDVSCDGQADGSITLTVTGGSGNYLYVWSGPMIPPGVAAPTGLVPGNYGVSVADLSGPAMVGTAHFVVGSRGPAPVADAGADVEFACAAGSGAGLDGRGSTVPAGATVAWTAVAGAGTVTSGASSLQPQVSGPGVFRLTITSIGGCVSSDEVTASTREAPTVAIANVDAITCARTSVTLVASADRAPADYTYLWTSPDVSIAAGAATSPTLVATEPGTYRVLVTDRASGCSGTGTVVVGDGRVAVDARATGGGTIDCRTTDRTLVASVAADPGQLQYTWSTADGTLAGGTAAPTASATAAGLYVVTIAHAPSGCSDTAQVRLTANTARPLIDAGADRVLTCGEDELTLMASPTGAGPYTYGWTSRDGSLLGPVDRADVRVDAAGTYVVTAVDPVNGCSTSDSLLVRTDLDRPTADAGGDGILGCGVPSVTLTGVATGTGALTTRWTTRGGVLSGPADQPTTQASAAGVYFLTVTLTANGCTATDSVRVTAATDLPAADAGAARALTCDIDRVTLAGSGSEGSDFEHAWSTTDGQLLAGTATDFAAVALAPGTYVLRVRNLVSGCESTSSVLVGDRRAPPPLTLPSAVGLPCDGTSATLIGEEYERDSLGFAFAWERDGQAIAGGARITATSAGTYRLLVTELATGCTNSAEVVVTAVASPEAELLADATELRCGRDTITLTVGSAALAPQWRLRWLATVPVADPSAPGRFFAVEPGEYRLVVSSADDSCVDTSSAVIVTDVRTRLLVDAGPDLVLGCEADVVLAQAVPPTAPAHTVRWSPLAGGAPVVDPSSLAGGFRESGLYLLTITDAATGCTGVDTVRVTRLTTAGLSARLGSDVELGCGGEALLQVDYEAPSDSVTFAWRQLDDPTATLPDSSRLRVAAPGIFEITLRYSPTGCTARDTITVTQVAGFVLRDLRDTTLACGDSTVVLAADIDNPGGAQLGFSWRAESGGLILAGGSSARAELTAGTYWLVVRDLEGSCTDSTRVVVTRESAAVAVARAGVELDPCFSTVTLLGNDAAGFAGSWTIVTGDSLALDPAAAQQTLVDVAAGAYVLRYALRGGGCAIGSADTLRFVVERPRAPRAYSGRTVLPTGTTDTSFQLLRGLPEGVRVSDVQVVGATGVLDSVGRVTIRDWAPGQPIVLSYRLCDPVCPGLCTDDRYELVRRPVDTTVDPADIGVPNAITPNNDGRNDAFVVEELLQRPDEYPNARLEIVNRWGDVLYVAQPYQNDWDGRGSDGRDLPTGTYYYVLELDLARSVVVKGHVTILR